MKHIRLRGDDLASFLAAYRQPENAEQRSFVQSAGLAPKVGEGLECFDAGRSKGDVRESFLLRLRNKIGRSYPSQLGHLLKRFRDALPRVLRISIFGFGVTHIGTCADGPNDPKLSDRGVRRGTCTVGGKAAVEAGAVTHGAVRCSAWLGVARFVIVAAFWVGLLELSVRDASLQEPRFQRAVLVISAL